MCSRSRTPASQGEADLDLTTTPGSAKSNIRRKANSDGLLLTKSGRESMINNSVNAKFDASSQIKTIKISPMFGADVVRLYKEANEAHPATTVVKTIDAAEKLRAVVGMDIKYMVGCDHAWTFPDD